MAPKIAKKLCFTNHQLFIEAGNQIKTLGCGVVLNNALQIQLLPIRSIQYPRFLLHPQTSLFLPVEFLKLAL
jgi:hypothetical protein